MRMVLAFTLAAALAAPAAAQGNDAERRAERERLEARIEELRAELLDLQRQRGELLGARAWSEPFVWSIVTTHRARLGVVVATSPSDADRQGARLQGVTPNGPAAEAGLRAGDIITRVNDQSLAGARPSPGQALIDAVNDLEDGDTVRVQYRRGETTGRATIIARTDDGPWVGLRAPNVVVRPRFDLRIDSVGVDSLIARYRGTVDPSEILDRALVQVREMPGVRASFFTSRWASMELTTLDADLGAYFGTTEGVLVVRAPADSLLGLKSGDVIRRIGGRVPGGPSQAIRILRSYESGDEIRIDIMRQRRQQTLTATVPEAEPVVRQRRRN